MTSPFASPPALARRCVYSRIDVVGQPEPRERHWRTGPRIVSPLKTRSGSHCIWKVTRVGDLAVAPADAQYGHAHGAILRSFGPFFEFVAEFERVELTSPVFSTLSTNRYSLPSLSNSIAMILSPASGWSGREICKPGSPAGMTSVAARRVRSRARRPIGPFETASRAVRRVRRVRA